MDNTTGTVDYAPSWVPEPRIRGTWGILYSCLFTLSLCVWSAIHLNIPPRGERWFWQWLRKTKWVFIAIFAPEIVLFSAWQQYQLARLFSRKLQDVCREQQGCRVSKSMPWWEAALADFMKTLDWESVLGFDEDDSRSPKAQQLSSEQSDAANAKHQQDRPDSKDVDDYSMTYAYFVASGGFVMNVRNLYDEVKASRSNHHDEPSWFHGAEKGGPSTIKVARKGDQHSQRRKSTANMAANHAESPLWVTVTPSGILEFAKCLPWSEFRSRFSIDKSSIYDKSKADPLGKMLVLLQVSWTFFNTVSRVTLGYPVSVLEVHTLCHVICALLMYILWWKKPLDIRDSSIINTEPTPRNQAFTENLALMLIRSAGSAYARFANWQPQKEWEKFQASVYPSFSGNEWPDRIRSSEAAFLYFDSSNVAACGQNDTGEDSDLPYSILQAHGNATPNDARGPHGASTANELDQQADGVFDLEAQLAELMPPPRGLTGTFRPALIEKVTPSHVACVQTLSTGELLPSGVGPAVLITAREETTTNRTTNAAVEVDSRLKAMIHLPFDLKEKNRKSRKITAEQVICHKLTVHLSQKDIKRWNLACEAFRRELTEQVNLPYWPLFRDVVPDHDSIGQPHSLHRSTSDIMGPRALDLTMQTSSLESEDLSPRPAKSIEVRYPTSRAQLLTLQDYGPRPAADRQGAKTTNSFCTRMRNLDFDNLVDMTQGEVAALFLVQYLIMVIVSGGYAGVHLALWNHDFPTTAEKLMWKISAAALGAPVAFLVLIIVGCSIVFVGFRAGKSVQKALRNPKSGWLKRLVHVVRARPGLKERILSLTQIITVTVLALPTLAWVLAMSGVGLVYFFARVYIVVESFLSLRRVPAGVYDQVSWATYIPHF